MNISTDYSSWYSRYLTQKASGLSQNDDASEKTEDTLLTQLLANTGTEAAGMRPKDVLDSLVDDGTITTEQKQAIKDALEKSRMAHRTQAGAENSALSNPIDSLVESGTITEEQASAVKSAFEKDRKSMMPPPPPPAATGTGGSDALMNILDSFVQDGTLSEDQKKSIQDAFMSVVKAYGTQAYSDTGYSENTFDMDI